MIIIYDLVIGEYEFIYNFRQRRTIAAKLQQGVKREKILDDIRDSVGQEFGKIHLVDKREIGKYN